MNESAQESNVVNAFNNINKNAKRAVSIDMKGQLYADIVSDHFQGFAQYKNYLIGSRNQINRFHGKILVMNSQFLFDFDSPSGSKSENYNHPGGLQILEDYNIMALAVETQDYKHSIICYYDLSNMDDNTHPVLLSNLTIDTPTHGTGMVGITRYQDAASGNNYFLTIGCDNGKLSFYRSNEYTFGDLNFKPNEISLEENDNLHDSKVHCISLFTDTNNHVWLLAFHFDEGSDTDRIKLFKIDTTNFKINTNFTPLNRHMINDYGKGPKGSAGIHFRWGSSGRLIGTTQMKLVACQRNIVADMMNYDIWADS